MIRRHARLQGIGTVHFVTTVTRHRGRWFVEPQLCTEMFSIFENYRRKYELACYGYVLMPDHLHAALLQTTETGTVARLMEHFKRFSSLKLLRVHCPLANGWRDLYDDVPVPGSDAVRTKLDYMHNNPAKSGLVDNPADYRWSSAPYYLGLIPWENSIITLSPNPW
jgi:putative transposase